MKLKKAMEKAKQERLAGNIIHSTESYIGEKPQPVKISVDANDWVAPTYSESIHFDVDPALLEKNRCVGMFTEAAENDYYKVLRTQIEHRTKERGWNTIMITSVQPGEGKTLTSINLSLTIAKAFSQTVLLVDCDLRQQQIHRYLGIPSTKGLVDCLMNDMPMKDIIIWPGIKKMTLISGGKVLQDSAEILGSPRMKMLVEEMKYRYDDRYVIFDTPPLLAGADAIAFAPLVDGIIIVIEEGKTSIKDVNKSLDLIPREKILGFVINKQRIAEKDKYSYGY